MQHQYIDRQVDVVVMTMFLTKQGWRACHALSSQHDRRPVEVYQDAVDRLHRTDPSFRYTEGEATQSCLRQGPAAAGLRQWQGPRQDEGVGSQQDHPYGLLGEDGSRLRGFWVFWGHRGEAGTQLADQQPHQAFPASTLSGCSVSCWQICRCVEGPGCDPTLGLSYRVGIDLANAALSNLFPGHNWVLNWDNFFEFK